MPHMGSPSRTWVLYCPCGPLFKQDHPVSKIPFSFSPHSARTPALLGPRYRLLAFPSLLGTNWKWTLPSSFSGNSPWELFPALRAVGDLLHLLCRRSPQQYLLVLSSQAEWRQPSTSSNLPCFISLLNLDTVLGHWKPALVLC